MANAFYGNVWTCDTPGIITKRPIWLRGIMFYPNAVDDAVLLNWWDESNPYTTSTIVGTVHGTAHIDSVGAFADTTIFADGNVVNIHHYTGAYKTANETYHLIGTRADNTLTMVEASLSTDSACTMSLTSYPARTAVKIVQPTDTNQLSIWMPFDGEMGFRFHNLTLETISGSQTFGTVILYLS